LILLLYLLHLLHRLDVFRGGQARQSGQRIFFAAPDCRWGGDGRRGRGEGGGGPRFGNRAVGSRHVCKAQTTRSTGWHEREREKEGGAREREWMTHRAA
jgi:hypothetical protein